MGGRLVRSFGFYFLFLLRSRLLGVGVFGDSGGVLGYNVFG